jgi:hypothetical protein
VSRVRLATFDQRQARDKLRVRDVAPVQGQARQQDQPRATLKLAAHRAPAVNLRERERRVDAIEQLETRRVHDRPVVGVATPPVHLRRGDQRRLVHQRRHHPGLVLPGLPQSLCQRVVRRGVGRAELFHDALHRSHFHAEGGLR